MSRVVFLFIFPHNHTIMAGFCEVWKKGCRIQMTKRLLELIAHEIVPTTIRAHPVLLAQYIYGLCTVQCIEYICTFINNTAHHEADEHPSWRMKSCHIWIQLLTRPSVEDQHLGSASWFYFTSFWSQKLDPLNSVKCILSFQQSCGCHSGNRSQRMVRLWWVICVECNQHHSPTSYLCSVCSLFRVSTRWSVWIFSFAVHATW